MEIARAALPSHLTLFQQDAFSASGGAPPPVFRDSLRWLSLKGLRVPGLLDTPPDARKVRKENGRVGEWLSGEDARARRGRAF